MIMLIAFSGPVLPSTISVRQEVEREIFMGSLTYWEKGENLKNRCLFHEKEERGSSHPPLWNPLLRIFMSAYQFIGIDLTTRAMGEYGRALNWPWEQFSHFSQNIVRQYCSANLSLFSRKELLRRLRAAYEKGTFLLPSTVGHRSFPGRKTLENHPRSLEKEFQRTTELFRSFCSWGGNIDRPRLLSFIFRDLSFSAFVMDKLAGVHSPSSREGVPISCHNGICRRTSKEDFWKQFPLTWRPQGLLKKLERAYCHRIRWLPARIHPKNTVLQNWVKKTSKEDRYFMHGQLRALITGIPEFLLQMEEYHDLVDFLQFPYRKSWGERVKAIS